MKNKKGNVPVIALIIVIVAISAGVFGWMFAKKTGIKSGEPVKSEPVDAAMEKQSGPENGLADETASWLTYTNSKIGFSIKHPSDWTYVSQNDDEDFSNGYLLPKEGSEAVASSDNPALEIGKVGEYLELNSLIMDEANFKNFNIKEYVTLGVGPYEEELSDWKEAQAKNGSRIYFYVTKIKNPNLDESKEGAIFVDELERKIVFVQRSYSMDGRKMSQDLREKMEKIARSFTDLVSSGEANNSSPADLISEIDNRFIKPLNKKVEYGDNYARMQWVKEDGRVICLNHNAQGLVLGQTVGIVAAVKNKTDGDISAYLKSIGFSENAKNTARGANGAGTIGFEKGNLKCKMMNYAIGKDGSDYSVVCANNTEEDRRIFDEFSPLLYDKEYPRGFFCLNQSEDNYAAGNASALDYDGLAYGGANVFAVRENGKWDIVVSQDILECSFVNRLPESAGIRNCWDESKKKEIEL